MVKLVVFFILSTAALIRPVSCHNPEYWNKNDLSIKLKHNVSFSLKPQFRYQNNLYCVKNDIGLRIYSIGIYFVITNSKLAETWDLNKAAYIETKYIISRFFLPMTIKIRLDYVIDTFNLIIRNGFKIEKDFSCLKIFSEDELFFNSNDNRINENRFSFGTSRSFLNMPVSVSYLIRAKENNNGWFNTTIFVTDIKLSF